MSYTPCKTCKCKCIWLPLNCLQNSDTILDSGLIVANSKSIETIIDNLQRTNIIKNNPDEKNYGLTQDCFDTICKCLTDIDYYTENKESCDKYQEIVDQAENMLIRGVDYVYHNRFGRGGKLTKSGYSRPQKTLEEDEFKSISDSLRASFHIERVAFESWLKANSGLYDCLTPINIDDCYDVDEDHDLFLSDWDTTKYFPPAYTSRYGYHE